MEDLKEKFGVTFATDRDNAYAIMPRHQWVNLECYVIELQMRLDETTEKTADCDPEAAAARAVSSMLQNMASAQTAAEVWTTRSTLIKEGSKNE